MFPELVLLKTLSKKRKTDIELQLPKALRFLGFKINFFSKKVIINNMQMKRMKASVSASALLSNTFSRCALVSNQDGHVSRVIVRIFQARLLSL